MGSTGIADCDFRWINCDIGKGSDIMGDIGKHFNRSEFACPCCGLDNIDLSFVAKLDKGRKLLDFPFKINSGCRCANHNKVVGGSPKSAHLPSDLDGKCRAVDIAITNSRERFKFLVWAVSVFSRIGIGKNFIHVDDDKSKTPYVIWVY